MRKDSVRVRSLQLIHSLPFLFEYFFISHDVDTLVSSPVALFFKFLCCLGAKRRLLQKGMMRPKRWIEEEDFLKRQSKH